MRMPLRLRVRISQFDGDRDNAVKFPTALWGLVPLLVTMLILIYSRKKLKYFYVWCFFPVITYVLLLWGSVENR